MTMFYFSGTGNSKYIAESFCKIMGAECHSIEENTDFRQLIESTKIIGFCYPIYFSRVPRIMREFANKYMESLKGKRLIIFCTQQILSGDGARALTDLFEKGHMEVIYAEHFFMPSNTFPITTNTAKIKKSFAKSRQKLQTVCRNIKSGKVRKRGFNVVGRALGLIQAPLALPIERKANNSIRIADSCTNCGFCVSVCPMNNLISVNGVITHNHNCTVCYRCVNGCPHKAITVVFHGKVKKQYKGELYVTS